MVKYRAEDPAKALGPSLEDVQRDNRGLQQIDCVPVRCCICMAEGPHIGQEDSLERLGCPSMQQGHDVKRSTCHFTFLV